jgi:hypothetical protein
MIRKNTSPTTTETEDVARAVQHIVQQYNVCGVVVEWPVQDEGWCGASCGRVLHALDHLTLSSSSSNSSPKPVCLYDPRHCVPPSEDEWGRAPIYSTTTKAKVVHCATPPPEDNAAAAAQVWREFCHEYWPELRDSNDESSAAVVSRVSEPPIMAKSSSSKKPPTKQQHVHQNVAHHDHHYKDEATQDRAYQVAF